MLKKKILIIEPDKLNDDVIKIFLNIMNDHANRIKDDYAITVKGMSSLNPKKATKLIKGEGLDKIQRAKFTCQLSSSACPVCLASLRK